MIGDADDLESPPAIGLSRARAVMRDYDPRWPDEFDREAGYLRHALDGLPFVIEHVGSTAVPGLPAKPLIDIAVGLVGREALEEARRRLVTGGYDDRGDFGEHGGVIVAKGPESDRTHLLHLVELGSRQWRRYLAFRDRLRVDPALRVQYAALKSGLAKDFWNDRSAYLEGKRAFVEEATDSAELDADGPTTGDGHQDPSLRVVRVPSAR